MEPSSSEFLILVEAPADYNTATGIAEKVILEYAPEWLKDGFETQKSLLFSWTGLENNTSFSCWKNIKEIEEQFKKEGFSRSRYLGFDGNSFAYDYPQGWMVLLLVDYLKNKKQRKIDAVLFIRDADTRSRAQERLEALNALREPFNNRKVQAIIGFAVPEREAWILNGFDPKTKDESERLKKIKKEIKFDPCKNAHQLRGKKNQPGTEARDIKRVLDELTDNNPLREEECWQEVPLSTLLERGKETGLTNYVEEVHTYLLPALIKKHR